MLDEYVDFLLSIFPNQDGHTLRKLKVVIDAGNGMAGHTAPAVMKRLNVDVTEMYFELDGTFPNHEANPIEPKNLVDLQKQVKKSKADIGLAFDGDADRCFLIDEKGDLVNPSALTCLIAARESLVQRLFITSFLQSRLPRLLPKMAEIRFDLV